MAITINHTGRRKLDKSQYEISLDKNEDGAPTFKFQLNSIDLDIEENSRVFVEANTRNTMQRFDFGTIGNISPPTNTSLDKLSATEPPRFQVLIVDFNGNQEDELGKKGRIRAKASGIRGSSGLEDDNGSSLLVVSTCKLDQIIWVVKMGLDDNRPELCLNDKVSDVIHLLKTKPEFQALILPAAFRQVLTNYYLMGTKNDTDDLIQQQWWQLATKLAGRDLPEDGAEDGDELPLWLDDVIDGFCRQHMFCDKLIEPMKDSEG